MGIGFQPINDDNLKQVTEIYNYYVDYSTATFHLEPVTSEEMKSMIPFQDERYPSYCIVYEGDIVGYCYLSNFRKKEAYDITAEITLYIYPTGTKKGIGTIVLEYLEKQALELGIKNLIAVITGENDSSVKLFERNGYVRVAHLKKVGFKFDRLLDVFWYQKEI